MLNATMTSPFEFDVAEMLNHPGIPEQRHQQGPSPDRIGLEMIAIPRNAHVAIEALLTPLGEGVAVEADVTAQLDGQCVRCLSELHPIVTLHISEVFSGSDRFISAEGSSSDDEDDEIPRIVDGVLDLTQSTIDAAGLTLPFNPVCEDGCPDTDVPRPDGVEEDGSVANDSVEKPRDPRWAGLEKYL